MYCRNGRNEPSSLTSEHSRTSQCNKERHAGWKQPVVSCSTILQGDGTPSMCRSISRREHRSNGRSGGRCSECRTASSVRINGSLSRVGGRHYARAVGNAVGANPLPIVIPCHRIVAHDASLGGFSGGLSMKRKLLSLEGTLDSTAARITSVDESSSSARHAVPRWKSMERLWAGSNRA